MSKKYWKGFRVDSIRLQSWDYGSDAAYFVTICTKDRQHFFEQIAYSPESEAEMRLTPIGQLAQQYWQEIPQQFPFAQLNAFVIMPDHMHGIIIIGCGRNNRSQKSHALPKPIPHHPVVQRENHLRKP